MEGIIREACVEGVEQALKAEQSGADRIELCARLDLDGTSPEIEVIKEVFEQLTIPIRVMIRPRAGGFQYSGEEFEQMIQLVHTCKEIGVEGIVFGALDAKNEIDLNQVNKLIKTAGPLKTVFHRAIEATSSIVNSVELLKKETAVDAILVSGTGGGRASDHVSEIHDLIRSFGDRELVVCGKVTQKNIEALHRQIGARSYHGKLIVGDLTNI